MSIQAARPSRGLLAFGPGVPVSPQGRVGKAVTCTRAPVLAKAKGGGSKGTVGGKTGKGFDPTPSPPEPPAKRKQGSRLEIMSPSDMRPLVDTTEEFVPRGPTMRESYVERGLMDSELGADAGVLPQVVADRMIRRIATFAGVPLGSLFLFFGAYFVAKYKYDISVIPAVVATSTLTCIGLAGVGITYGIFSSSWDEDEEGSKLGWKEAGKNILLARDGLSTMLNKERQEDAQTKTIMEVNKWREKRAKGDDK